MDRSVVPSSPAARAKELKVGRREGGREEERAREEEGEFERTVDVQVVLSEDLGSLVDRVS